MDGFRKGWNLTCEHLNDRINQVDAERARYDGIEAALNTTRRSRRPAPMRKPTAKLKPIQRAFMLGFRYGFRRARTEMRREVDDAVDRLEATTAEIKAERKALRSEFRRRLKAIETGVNLERDPVEHPWLH